MPSISTSTLALATEILSVTEQRELLTAAQNVPTIVALQDDGTEVVRHIATPASEAAMERLTVAFLPAVRKAALAAKVVDRDEAEAVALTEFVEAVRDYDLSDDLPFSATIATRLRWAVKKADRGNDIIRVKNTVAAAYWSLMHRHEGDFATAYAAVKVGGLGLSPDTFLAVHLIMSGVDSIDVTAGDSDHSYRAQPGGTANVSRHEGALADRGDVERIAVDAEIAWLFEQVSDRQESILRLACGFEDLATETISVGKGFRPGDVLDDGQIAYALDLTRPTVQRDRKKALVTMRAALAEQALAESE